MIDHLSLAGSSIHVHVSESSLKTTKAFTHGRLVFDLESRTSTFGKLLPVAIPNGLALADGTALKFQLVAPNVDEPTSRFHQGPQRRAASIGRMYDCKLALFTSSNGAFGKRGRPCTSGEPIWFGGWLGIKLKRVS